MDLHPGEPDQRPEVATERLRGDDGVVAVFVALGVVAMLMIGAVVVDGGRAYYQRRAMQNAADAAAMAGTRAIDQVHWLKQPDSYVEAQVIEQVENHGGVLEACYILDYLGSRLAPSTGTCAAGEVADKRRLYGAQALGGVEVKVSNEVNTFLAHVGDSKANTVKVTTGAAATVQVFEGGTGAPFLLCGVPSIGPGYNAANPSGDIYDMTKTSPYAYPILLGANEAYAVDINGIKRAGFDTNHVATLESPKQTYIPVQHSQQRSCGGGDALKGKVKEGDILVGRACTATQVMCDTIGADNGNGYDGEIANIVLTASPCSGNFTSVTNCDILLPIIDYAIGNGSHMKGHVVGWASAHITGDGSGDPKYRATINVDATTSLVSSGYSAAGPIGSQGTPRMVKLVR